MSHDVLSPADPPVGDVSLGVTVDEVSSAAPAVEPAADVAFAEPAEGVPPVDKSADRRAAVLAAVRDARDLPPGVRERLTTLVEHAATLDLAGDPLLSTRQVLELLSQGLPPVLRRETSTAVERPAHPTGDAFFAANSDELSDQQAEQIARQQLQRAGLLRAA
jgi:hypothetical protein